MRTAINVEVGVLSAMISRAQPTSTGPETPNDLPNIRGSSHSLRIRKHRALLLPRNEYHDVSWQRDLVCDQVLGSQCL